VDGKAVDTKKVPHTTPFIFQWDETFDVGSDTGTPVDDRDYQCPFVFTGKFTKLTVEIGPMQLQPAEKKEVQKKIGERD
jgi:arylsulfatase